MESQTRKPLIWTKIDKSMIPIKIVYFLFFAGSGSLIPYLPLFMKQLGLSPIETGVIFSVLPFIAFCVRPVFGMIADKTRSHKRILMICCVMTGVTHCLLLLVPNKSPVYSGSMKTNLTEKNNTNVLANFENTFSVDGNFLETSSSPSNEVSTSLDITILQKNTSTIANTGSFRERVRFNYYAYNSNGGESLDTNTGTGHNCSGSKNLLILLCSTKSITLQSLCVDEECIYTQTANHSLSEWISSITRPDGSHSEFMPDQLCKDDSRTNFGTDGNNRIFAIETRPDEHIQFFELFPRNNVTVIGGDVKLSQFPFSISTKEIRRPECINVPIETLVSSYSSEDTSNYNSNFRKCCGKYSRPSQRKERLFEETFWLFFALFILASIFFSPNESIINAIAFAKLGDKRDDWGKQRVWGTIGCAILAFLSSYLVDLLSESEAVVDFSIAFYLYITMNVFAAMAVFKVNSPADIKSRSFLRNILLLIRIPEVTLFLLLVTCFGIMHSVLQVFLFWYLTDLGSHHLTMGLCLVVNCVSEIVVMYLSGTLIRKFGHVVCLSMAMGFYALRFLSYSFLTSGYTWYVLPIESLHGLSFGIGLASASSYADLIAPKGMIATLQGLVSGLTFGLGRGLGSLVTGKLLEPEVGLGEVWCFRVYSCFALFVFLVWSGLHMSGILRTNKPDEESAVNEEILQNDLLPNKPEMNSP